MTMNDFKLTKEILTNYIFRTIIRDSYNKIVMIEFELKTEYIELIKLLKVLQLVESGGQAKLFVDDGLVMLNGKVEHRKRAKLRKGDQVQIDDELINIV